MDNNTRKILNRMWRGRSWRRSGKRFAAERFAILARARLNDGI